MPPDAAYAMTRRRGELATITRVVGDPTFNPETGDITPNVSTTSVRWMVKETTKYSRIIRGQATQTDVGATTFIMWAPDVDPIVNLDSEDIITFGGKVYNVRSAMVEDGTSFVVTADTKA